MSLVITLQRPIDEDEREVPDYSTFCWESDNSNITEDKLRSIIGEYRSNSVRRQFKTLIDVDANTTLFSELQPLIVVSLQSSTKFAEDGVDMFGAANAFHYETAAAADAHIKKLPFAPMWFMVTKLLLAYSYDNLTTWLPTPRGQTHAELMLKGVIKLSDVDLAWIGEIRRRFERKFSWREAVALFGIVSAATTHERCDTTGIVYALALYRNLAWIPHSCAPTCRVHYEGDGRVRLMSAIQLRAGAPLSIDRHMPPSPSIAGMIVSPTKSRAYFQSIVGHGCACDEVCRPLMSQWRATDDAAVARYLIAVESVWKAGVAEELSTVFGEQDVPKNLATPVDVYLAHTRTLVLETFGADRLERLWAMTGNRSTLPVEMALATMRLALTMPAEAASHLGRATVKAAAQFAVSKEAREAIVSILQRQQAPAALVRRRLCDYSVAATALAFSSVTIEPIVYHVMTKTKPDQDVCARGQFLLTELEHAITQQNYGQFDDDEAPFVEKSQARLVAGATRTMRSLLRNHMLIYDAILFVTDGDEQPKK